MKMVGWHPDRGQGARAPTRPRRRRV